MVLFNERHIAVLCHNTYIAEGRKPSGYANFDVIQSHGISGEIHYKVCENAITGRLAPFR